MDAYVSAASIYHSKISHTQTHVYIHTPACRMHVCMHPYMHVLHKLHHFLFCSRWLSAFKSSCIQRFHPDPRKQQKLIPSKISRNTVYLGCLNAEEVRHDHTIVTIDRHSKVRSVDASQTNCYMDEITIGTMGCMIFDRVSVLQL